MAACSLVHEHQMTYIYFSICLDNKFIFKLFIFLKIKTMLTIFEWYFVSQIISVLWFFVQIIIDKETSTSSKKPFFFLEFHHLLLLKLVSHKQRNRLIMQIVMQKDHGLLSFSVSWNFAFFRFFFRDGIRPTVLHWSTTTPDANSKTKSKERKAPR